MRERERYKETEREKEIETDTLRDRHTRRKDADSFLSPCEIQRLALVNKLSNKYLYPLSHLANPIILTSGPLQCSFFTKA